MNVRACVRACVYGWFLMRLTAGVMRVLGLHVYHRIVPALPGVLVVNIGDMLDKLTQGRYQSTPHRAKNSSTNPRISFPLFYDPSWDAQVTPLPLEGSQPAAVDRW